MSLQAQLEATTDDLVRALRSSLAAERAQRVQQVAQKIRTYRPDTNHYPSQRSWGSAKGIEPIDYSYYQRRAIQQITQAFPTPPPPAKEVVVLDSNKLVNEAKEFTKKYFGESPIDGMDQSTYDQLSRLASQANSQPQQTKKDSIMSLFNIPGLSAGAFGKLTGNRIAIGFDGQVVFRKPDGSYVKLQVDAEGNKQQVQVLDFKLDVDFYRVPTQTLAVGDLIELDGQLLYVEETNAGGLKFVNPLTGNKSSKLQQTNILGLHFYSKIVSLFELGGQQGGVGLNGINPMMLLALQGKGGASGDISELLILSSLMGAQGQAGGIFGGQGGFNPMLLMMLGDKAENETMKQFMMLQAFAGQGGANPFAPASAVVPAAPVVAQKAAPRKTAAPKKAAAPAKKTVAKKAAPKKAARKATPATK